MGPPGTDPECPVCFLGQENSRVLPSQCVPGCQAPPGTSLPVAHLPEASATSVSPGEGEGGRVWAPCWSAHLGTFPYHMGYHSTS